MKWPMVSPYGSQYKLLKSDEFELCGSKWLCIVYPVGLYDESEHMGMRLCNLSNGKYKNIIYSHHYLFTH